LSHLVKSRFKKQKTELSVWKEMAFLKEVPCLLVANLGECCCVLSTCSHQISKREGIRVSNRKTIFLAQYIHDIFHCSFETSNICKETVEQKHHLK
jgi:hypothetical protein